MGLSMHISGLPAPINVDFARAAQWEPCLWELLCCYYHLKVTWFQNWTATATQEDENSFRSFLSGHDLASPLSWSLQTPTLVWPCLYPARVSTSSHLHLRDRSLCCLHLTQEPDSIWLTPHTWKRSLTQWFTNGSSPNCNSTSYNR